MTNLLRWLVLGCIASALAVQPALAQTPADSADALNAFGLEGCGVVNYFAYDWEIDPARPNAVDLERFVLYPSYQFAERVRLLGEIEFEHGGTGVTKELVSGEPGFLHYGCARTLTEAILWHGGEAETAREGFKRLSEAERDALLAFLKSL